MMEETVLSPLARWENFYVIVGSSAGALTGLQFVVITLIAEADAASSTSVRAFGTPTVVDFCVTLLISAIVSAPWHTLSAPAVLLIACGICGVLYTLRAVYHARRQTEYKPDFGDWTWYVTLPLLAYAALAVAASQLAKHPTPALFGVAATSLGFLFIGIHNAWDTVTYIAVRRSAKTKEK
jgi:hypothetical protein